jgi:hypothetical protein
VLKNTLKAAGSRRKLLFLAAFLFSVSALSAQQYGESHTVFKAGEKVSFKIYYHWHFVWMESGDVTFQVSAKDYYGVPSYYFQGFGKTYPKYDWFYKVRDTFQAYLDTLHFAPLRFIRASHEGGTNVSNDNVFDNSKHKVYCLAEDEKGKYHEDTITGSPGLYDVLCGIYYTRCLNFDGMKKNDTVPLKLYLDGKIYHVHLRYLGKEEVTTAFGKYRCIKFGVNLISGTIFKEGDEMTVWATDDKNRLPIYIEAPIIIGSVRAELQSFSGLRNAMDAKVK